MDDWCCRSTLGAAADFQAWPASLYQRGNSYIEKTSTPRLSLASAFPLLRLGPARRRCGRGDRRRRDSGERAGSGARGWRITISAGTRHRWATQLLELLAALVPGRVVEHPGRSQLIE